MTEYPDGLRELSRRVERFCDERDWGQFHNTKDLAISLALEASEVLEVTQWKNEGELESDGARARLGEELSDVLY
jgi:NTP pyrophosphatase (non-canonical NTP hydrolase)